ncbi:MAG: hypothetical protein GY906_02645, partial [bacterium]|nr:hypothetical protein [bacterium]
MKSRSATTRCQTQFRLINAVSLVVWLTSASFGAAAVETSVIRQDCASYTGPYNCYQSLAAWQADLGGINFGAATPGDLVTADVIAEARIEGSWSTADTTRFELGIWNTDPDHYVWIHTTSEARHDGTAGSGYRYAPTDPAQTPLYITVSHLRLAGLEIHADSAYDGSVVYIRPPSVEGVGEIALGHNLIHGNGMNSASGILNYGCAGTLWIWNCIIWDVGDPGYTAGIQSGIGRVIASNNTISGIISGFGIRSSSGIVARNNLCNAPGDDFYGSFALGTDFNASTDNTAPGIHSHRNQNFSFVNPTLPDYHLAASDTGAANRGTDLSADLEWPFTDDVDGEVRVRAWDIGADEQASAIDSTPPVRLNGAPTGSLPPETTETVISLNTNEAAICRVDTVPGVPFASMPVVFGNTGGTSHSQTVTALYEEQTFSYYVRCQDAGANANLDDFIITFSVASSDGVSPVIENVEIVDIGPYSATIAWTTDEPATTQLEYGPSSALGRFSLRDPTLTLNHEMLLDGLDPATTYYFRAHSQDYAGNESESSTHAFTSLAIVGPVYHVDQNHPLANDTNDGSEAAPWLTIQHAADVASPGDTVIVHPGSYGRVRFNHG